MTARGKVTDHAVLRPGAQADRLTPFGFHYTLAGKEDPYCTDTNGRKVRTADLGLLIDAARRHESPVWGSRDAAMAIQANGR